MARYRFGVDELVSDLSLGDFANARLRAGCCRSGKGRTSAAALSKGQIRRQTKDWWELEDGDLDDEEAVDEEDAEPVPVCPRVRRRRKRWWRAKEEAARQHAEHWPLDLWHCIAAYVRPEDIGRFAAIAPLTRDIVAGTPFWKDLYKRFQPSANGVHESLRAKNETGRLFGLRTRVIQLLFYSYPAFCSRVQPSKSVQLSPKTLSRLALGRLSSVWSSPAEQTAPNGARAFFFKLLLRNHKRCPVSNSKSSSGSQDIVRRLEYLDDITYNPERGFVVLKVVCKCFTEVPSRLLGWLLCEVSFPLASDLTSHRLRLTFQSTPGWEVVNGESKPMGKTGSLSLSGVTALTLLDWWHPQYPAPPF